MPILTNLKQVVVWFWHRKLSGVKKPLHFSAKPGSPSGSWAHPLLQHTCQTVLFSCADSYLNYDRTVTTVVPFAFS